MNRNRIDGPSRNMNSLHWWLLENGVIVRNSLRDKLLIGEGPWDEFRGHDRTSKEGDCLGNGLRGYRNRY